MEDKDRPVGPRRTVAANDNGTADMKLNAVVVRIARLLGRQIAREEFERRCVANDNRPAPDTDEE